MIKHWLAGATALSLLTGAAVAQTQPERTSIDQPNAAVGKTKPSAAASASTKSLQESLNREGAKISVDGRMGPKTAAALRDFQRVHGLPVTGRPDAETQKALDVADAQRRSMERAPYAGQPNPPADGAKGASGVGEPKTSGSGEAAPPAKLEFPEERDNGGYHDD